MQLHLRWDTAGTEDWPYLLVHQRYCIFLLPPVGKPIEMFSNLPPGDVPSRGYRFPRGAMNVNEWCVIISLPESHEQRKILNCFIQAIRFHKWRDVSRNCSFLSQTLTAFFFFPDNMEQLIKVFKKIKQLYSPISQFFYHPYVDCVYVL